MNLLLAVLLLLSTAHPPAQSGRQWVVAPDGDFSTIAAALAAAQNGDTITVKGGNHPAPLTIDKSIHLLGVDDPVIDGSHSGSLVYITAPDVVFAGFTIKNSGGTVFHEDTGIIVQAANVTLADNHLENVLFGIYFSNAAGGIAQNNVIIGQDRDLGLRGDGIRVWYSDHVQLLNNDVRYARDTIISYSDNVLIRGNHFRHNRYGLHFMYIHQATVEQNYFEENGVGAFLMYAQGVNFAQNTFAYQEGASGYGLALKDTDGAVIMDNVFVGNQIGVYLDNSPAMYEGFNTFSGNLFAYNSIGVTTLPSVERNIFSGNSFIKNGQQSSMNGREITSRNQWTGNFWSDYSGYDQNGDGRGETPYRADKFFESLSDQHPNLRLFAHSPAVQALAFTAAAFPLIRPTPKLVDDAPLMRAVFPAHLEKTQAGGFSAGLLAFSLALMLATVALAGAFFIQKQPKALVYERAEQMIVVENLSKKYQDVAVLNGMHFHIQRGEAVALWGVNGAGKTTTIKCLLGLLPYEGTLHINGLDVRTSGKAVRTAVGYVPQEAAFYDLTVRETLKFYAQLKKVGAARQAEVLARVGLSDQAKKPVAALSGGMKQRLALAVSLLSDPPVLLLDEPTANLDAQAQADFLQLIGDLNQAGKTVVFSSHRLDEVAQLAERVLVLQDGSVAFDCRPSELASHLGLQQRLRIQVAEAQRQNALALLVAQGFATKPNTTAFYVEVGSGGKMAPLRVLEAAHIRVEDFELVEGD